MDLFVQAVIEAAIQLGQYLVSLPEQDRQAAIDRFKAQHQITAAQLDALRTELDALKALHKP